MITSLKRRDTVRFIVEYLGLDALFAYFFYQSLLAFLIFMPGVYFYLKLRRENYREAARQELAVQFKDCLCAVEASLSAGISLENAFVQALDEMRRLHGQDSLIVKELLLIKGGLENNYPITVSLTEMSRRWDIRELRDFVNLLTYGKQRGGSMINILHSYISIYEARMELRQEISAMIAARRYEQRIMNAVPFFIIFYVNLTNKGFLQVLYHNPAGCLIMTLAMGIYLLSVYMANRIIAIDM